MSESPMTQHVGFVLFPGLTQLDLTGPWEVLTRIPATTCYLLHHNLAPVRSASGGLSIVPTMTYAACPQLDMLCVPGGPGHLEAMTDEGLLSFLQAQASGCRFVTAVCTGALVLAAAGLLRGYECTTHWMSLDRLIAFGAKPVPRRVVFDRNRITGGGVTAGIDFALAVAAEVAGEQTSREIQLQMEYEPEPPFGGSPATANAETVAILRNRYPAFSQRMKDVDATAAAKLSSR